MKIGEAIIQNRNIQINTDSDFEAIYKNRTIIISSDHGHGKPKYKHLTRFDIVVLAPTGEYDVNTWEDCHSIKEAIRVALRGACLIKSN